MEDPGKDDCSHVAPLSVVSNRVPSLPETRPFPKERKARSVKSDAFQSRIRMDFHVFPPSDVLRSVPSETPAQPSLCEIICKDGISWAVPEGSMLHVDPPSAVFKRMPFAPAIHAADVLDPGTLTSKRSALVPDGFFFHVLPPSVVLRMSPPSPTTKPVEEVI